METVTLLTEEERDKLVKYLDIIRQEDIDRVNKEAPNHFSMKEKEKLMQELMP